MLAFLAGFAILSFPVAQDMRAVSWHRLARHPAIDTRETPMFPLVSAGAFSSPAMAAATAVGDTLGPWTACAVTVVRASPLLTSWTR